VLVNEPESMADFMWNGSVFLSNNSLLHVFYKVKTLGTQ